MSVRRAVVDCAVLSVRDARVLYPSCRGCCSRLDVEQHDQTSCRCSKCGYRCAREQVDYRYRLSLTVTRDSCIFGVTVFGACLNPFFGIHASGLHRLVETLDGPVGASTRSTLLQRAVEDCFIGKHFIFGLKASGTESWPWAGVNGSGPDTAHYIASQMILPRAPGLEGCTVVQYYQTLLQKAAEYELDINDPGKTSRPPATTLMLLPHHSPTSSIGNASGLPSQSLQRFLSQDSSLAPTPPWQQSLGLITSSAEQEEDCVDRSSRQTVNNIQTQRGCWEDELVLSPLSPRLSLANFKYSPAANSSVLATRFSPSSPGHKLSKTKGSPAQEPAETSFSSSVAWEDFPMSESLTEFLCKENQNVEPAPQLNVQNQKDSRRTSSETRPQDKGKSSESSLLDATNTSVLEGGGVHDSSDQVWKNPTEFVDGDRATKVCPHECNQEEEKGNCLLLENEEQLDGDTYNCSADLFGSSAIDVNTVNMQAATVKMSTEASPDVSKSDRWHRRSQTVHVPQSTPHRRKHRSTKRRSSDCFMLQDFDFIPPSQSTPIVRAAVLSPPPTHRTTAASSESCAQSARRRLQRVRNLPDFDHKKPAKSTSPCQSRRDGESSKENLALGGASTRNSYNFTPKRKFLSKGHLQPRQHRSVQESPPDTCSTGTTGSQAHVTDDVTACDYEDCEAIAVPPTPAAQTQGSVLLRRQWTDSGGHRQQQRDGAVRCKRPLLDQTLTATCRAPPRAGSCEANMDGSHRFSPDDEDEACDWSRDLFSDSV